MCKHFPHAGWRQASGSALLTEGSTVLKQMQRSNNSSESGTRPRVRPIGFCQTPGKEGEKKKNTRTLSRGNNF